MEKCRELAQNICRICKIEEEINSSRVKIRINQADNYQYFLLHTI